MTSDVHEFLGDLMALCRRYETMLTGGVFDFADCRVDIMRCCDREVTGNEITRAQAQAFKVERDGND